jgi:hypothetical protein
MLAHVDVRGRSAAVSSGSGQHDAVKREHVRAQQIVCVHALSGGLLVAVQLLDALERIAI